MKETAGRGYLKDIIEEYNILLKSWGHSDDWSLNQFKTLESMIFEVTKIDVNANTLKRFFQQRTGNPQLATKEALCLFLGYKGYTDFVMKKTKEEAGVRLDERENQKSEDIDEIQTQEREVKNEDKNEELDSKHRESEHTKKLNKRYFYLSISLIIIIGGYLFYTYKLKDMYIDYLISKIEFSASQVKGLCPLTVTFSYNIPSSIFDDITIVYEEATGDILEKKLNKAINTVNATYIYEGEGACYLKYKDKEIRRILVESRKAGWSVFVKEERKGILKTLPVSQAFNENGYISLPFDSIPGLGQSNHLFVSYIFYQKSIIDGDNFILEARMRNSAEEHAIPCADVMMYMGSDKGVHGFTMNENCHAYMKFISGESEIKGERHSLERFNFNPSEWHVMTIKVINKHTTFYVDGAEILNMNYNNSLGIANEIILRFKGCGAVDYVKVCKPNGEVVYEENFDEKLY